MVKMIYEDIIIAAKLYIPDAIISGIIVLACICIVEGFVMKGSERKALCNSHIKQFVVYVFYVYCFLVVGITFLSRTPGSREGVDLMLFDSISRSISAKVFAIENILLFIPLGFLLPLIWNKFYSVTWCIVAGFICSVMIEMSQFIMKRGYFQIDDIVLNTFGALIGNIVIVALMKVKTAKEVLNTQQEK